MSKTLFGLVLAKAVLLLVSCTGEDDGAPTLPPTGAATDVLVLNEGLFRRGNGSLTRYNRDEQTASQVDIDFQEPTPLDVVQSALILEDSLLLLISNNTNTLHVLRRRDLAEVGRYSGLGSPRYAAILDPQTVLVSDLNSPGLLKLSLGTGTRQVIDLPRPAEALLIYQRLAVLTAPTGQHTYVLDLDSMQLVDSIAVGPQVTAIVREEGGRLFAAAGVQDATGTGRLLEIDLANRSSEVLLTFPNNESSLYPRLVVGADQVYCLQRDLVQISLAGGPAQSRFRLEPSAIYYGLGYDDELNELYLGDANQFLGPGRVLRFSQLGVPLDTFSAGFLPSGFVFP